MYKKGDKFISLEDAEKSAIASNMSLDGWANFYGWSLEEDTGKEQDPAQPPMMGPEKKGGDSSLENGSSALPIPSSYLIDTEQIKSKREQRQEQSLAIYEQEQMQAFDPSALDPRIQRPEAQEATAVKSDIIPEYAGLGVPTLLEQDEFEREEKDLDIEDSQSTNLFINPSIYNQETGKYERKNELVKKYYSSVLPTTEGPQQSYMNELRYGKTDSIQEIKPTQGKSAFENLEFNEEIYAELQKYGLSVDNFEGFLRRDPLAQEYFERIERGDFEFDEFAPVKSRFVFINPEPNTGLSPTEEKKLTEQRILRELFERYVETVNDHANRRAFSKDLRDNPEKYKDFVNYEDAYDSYVYNNGYGEIIKDTSGYTENRFAELKAFEDEQTKTFLEKITDKDGGIEGRNSLEAAESIVRNFGIAAQRGMVLDPYIAVNSFLGFKGEAAKMRDQKALADMRLSHLNKGIYFSPPAGKLLEIDGTEYLLGDDDLLYNLSAELVASSYLDPKELFEISEKVKTEGVESTYNRNSFQGGAIQMGSIFGALIPQVLGMKGAGAIRSSASRSGIKNINKVRKSAGLKAINTRARAKNGRFVSTKDTFGVKLPFNPVYVDNVLFSSYYGYQNGVESTFEAARNAGLTEEQSYELAETAGRQMAILYAVTGPINPRLPFSKFLGRIDKWLKTPSTMQAAINGFRKDGVNGFKRALTEGFGAQFARGTARTLKVFAEEGAKETVQENIQQWGEFTIVNANTNYRAGQQILKEDYTYNDFINTSILSFAVGGFSGSLGTINLPSARRNKLQNLYIISQDLKGAKVRLNANVKNNMMSQEEADNILKAAENFKNHANKVPRYFAADVNNLIETVNLLGEQAELELENKNLNKSLQKQNNERLTAIQEELNVLEKKARAAAIDTETKAVKKIIGEENVVVYQSSEEMKKAKDANGKPLFDNKALNSEGIFMDSNNKIYINREIAIQNKAVGVASHELLHRILKSQFGNITENETKVINDLLNMLPPDLRATLIERAKIKDKNGNQVYDITIDKDGKVTGNDIDEFITFLSDEMALGTPIESELTLKELGRIIMDFIKSFIPGYNADFKDGTQVLNFLIDYRSGLAKSKLSYSARKKMKASLKSSGKDKKSISTKKDLFNTIKDVQPKDAKTKAEFQADPGFTDIYMLLQPGQAVHNFIVSKFPGQTEKVRGVIESLEERLINFDPQSKRKGTSEEIGTDGFVEFLMANINFATLDANKKLAQEATREKQTTSTDNEGAKQIAEETTDTSPQVSVKPEYKSLLRRRVVSEDVVKDIEQKVLRIVSLVKSRIDAKVSNNVTVTPLIREIKKEAGKMIDIELKKAMGGKKDGELRKFLLRNKAAILENMSTTWLSQAMPFAVQKRVEGVWTSDWKGKKIDRETMSTDLAGRTSGADMVRRVPKIVGAISDAEFLAAIVDSKGAPLRGKKESLAKAIAEEITFDIIKKSFDENGPIAQAIIENQKRSGVENAENMGPEFKRQAERGNVKFSVTAVDEQRSTLIEYFNYDRNTDIGRFGRQLVSNKTIDALLNEYGLKDRYDLSDPKQFEQYWNDIKNILVPLMPKWFWLTPGTKYSPLLSNKRSLGKTSKKLTDKEFSDLQEKLIERLNGIDESKFGAPIKGVDISRPRFQRYLKSGNLGKRKMFLTAKNIFLRENAAKGATVKGDVLAYNLYVEAIHEAMWQRAAEAIKNDINSARVIGTFMSMSTNDINHPHRLARIGAWSKDFERKDITIEHATPSMIVATTLLNKALAVHPGKKKNKKKKLLAGARVDFNTFYKAVAENYVVVALNKVDDKKSSMFFRSTLPKGWNILEGNWYDRYFNSSVSKIDGGIDPNSLILPSGRSIAEVTGISKNGSYRGKKLTEFMKKNNLDLSSSKSAQAKQAVMSEAWEKGQRKYSVSFQPPDVLKTQFNEMLSRKSGIDAATEISRTRGQILGKDKGRFKFFIAPGADDFRGLVHYAFAGKGKQGEKDMEFFEKNLMDPYFRGIAAIDAMRQLIKREFKVVTKEFKDEYAMLSESVPGTPFTYDHALRVYMWGLAGTEVPGLSDKDRNDLENAILDNPALADLAEALLIVGRREAWPKPSEFWLGDSVLSDLNSMTEKIGRKEILAQFITNVDAMFDEATLNKIEAIKGRKHREALEDAIYAMKNGSNRPSGANIQTNKWINWINGSTGAIMFFNRRSALLQMLSFTNFINWSDNNPIKAAAAFANQKQYWKDFVFLFNSDKLKERRGGLKQDVSESEIAQVAGRSKNSPQAILAYMLKIGFTPTQIADSMAIATGGATFYRNRINTYLKEGMSQKKAEEKAFEDFSKASDVAQQSSDPALVSQQQRSILGRFILAFANTPMQYTRLMKKAGQDLINGRGNPKEHISKILYYGFVQNFIFSALQSAMFGLFFDDEEDDEIRKKNADKKLLKTVNSMVDTILRGSGVYGAILSTIKNTIQQYYTQEGRGFMADHAYTLLSAFNVSPPIGSKFRKLYTAIQTKRFEEDAIAARGWAITANGRVNLGPNWAILGSLVSGAANVPLDRVYDEINSISEALDARNKAWQRIALALGWKTWDVGAKNEEEDLIETLAKEKRKEEGKKKAAETRERKKKEELEAFEKATEGMSAVEKSDYANQLYREKALKKIKAKKNEIK
jgi:hypothetical protein